jgi:hypothetical protein
VPENHVFTGAEFAVADEINQSSKCSPGVHRVKQYAFTLRHEPYRLAFEIAYYPIARTKILVSQKDIG